MRERNKRRRRNKRNKRNKRRRREKEEEEKEEIQENRKSECFGSGGFSIVSRETVRNVHVNQHTRPYRNRKRKTTKCSRG